MLHKPGYSPHLSSLLTAAFSTNHGKVLQNNVFDSTLIRCPKSQTKIKSPFGAEDLLRVKNLYSLLEQIAQKPLNQGQSESSQAAQREAAHLLHYFAFHKDWDDFLGVIRPIYALIKLDARLGEVFSQVWRNLANVGYFNTTHTSMQLLAVQLETSTVASHWKIPRKEEFLKFEAALTVALQQYYSELGWVVAFPQLISQAVLTELPACVFMAGQKTAYDLACGVPSSPYLYLPQQSMGIPDTRQSLYFIPFVWGVVTDANGSTSPRAESQEQLWASVQDSLDGVINQSRSIKSCPSRGSSIFTHGVTRISPGDYCNTFV